MDKKIQKDIIKKETQINVIIKHHIDFKDTFTKKLTINSDDLIGDFINKIMNENIINDYSALFLFKNSKFIGYDYLLNYKFSKYPELINPELELTIFNELHYNSANKRIFYPLIYFKNSIIWPPAQNWEEGDVINMGKFLIWNGWGKGSTEVTKEEDNSYKNLIVLKYLNSNDTEIKKVVNKYCYLKALGTHNKDPFINKVLKPYCSLLVKSSVLYNQPKNRPLLEIPIIY